MHIIKAKNLVENDIKIHTPKAIINGKSFAFPVTYGHKQESLMIQLPRCQLSTGLYESDGKCYCEILIPRNGITSTIYAKIALQVESLLKSNSKHQTCNFVGHLRNTTDDSAQLRLKFPQNRAKVTTSLVSEQGNPVSMSRVTKGAMVLPIVVLENVYVINETIGFNLMLNQLVCLDS